MVAGGVVGVVGVDALPDPDMLEEPWPPPQPASARALAPATSQPRDDRILLMPNLSSTDGRRPCAFTQPLGVAPMRAGSTPMKKAGRLAKIIAQALHHLGVAIQIGKFSWPEWTARPRRSIRFLELRSIINSKEP